MKRTLIGACVLAAIAGSGGGADLSVAPGHHGGAVRRRRADRRARRASWRSACAARSGRRSLIENVTGASGTHRRSAASRARRRTATRWCIGNWASFVVNSAIYQDAVRLRERISSRSRGSRAIPTSSWARRTLPQRTYRADRLAQGQPDKAIGRDRRRRLRPACRRRLFPEGHRDALPVRALSRRLVRRDARSRRRAHRSDLRSGDQRRCLYLPAARCAPMRSPTRRGLPPRRTFRPWTKPARPASTYRPGSGCGCRRARRRRWSRGSARPRMEALADPAVQKRLADLGQDIPPPEQQTAEALAAHLKAEIDKWWPIIREANIKVEQ